MNEYDMVNAIGSLDPELVEKAAAPKKRRAARRLITAASIAAAIALVLGVTAAIAVNSKNKPEKEGVEAEATETEPPVDSPEFNSLISFFKYNNEIYLFDKLYRDSKELVGECLGQTKHRITGEVKSFDEVPDLSGPHICKFYAVKGFDPETMICAVDGNNVSVFLNIDRTRFRAPEEILEGAFHASEYMSSLVFEAADSLDGGYDERFILDPEYMRAANEFISLLDAGEWVPRAEDGVSVPDLYGSERFELTLCLGVYELKIIALEDGRAFVHPLLTADMEYFIRFDPEYAAPFFALLRSGEHCTPAPPTSSVKRLRAEALRSEPNFGAYFPDSIDGYSLERAYIHYKTDLVTGAPIPETVTSITADYRRGDGSDGLIRLTVSTLAELQQALYGTDKEHRYDVPIDSLAVGSVPGFYENDSGVYRVAAYDDSIAITVNTSSSLTPEEIVALIRECFGK